MVIITGNQISNNLWGVTLIDKTVANLGSDDADDFNPGGNIFSNNGNGGQIYALYNNTANPVKALHNCWIEGQESAAEEVESVIFHKVDDESLGEVFYDPFDCGITNANHVMALTKLNVFPNPSAGLVHVQAVEAGKIRIYDMRGNNLVSKKTNGHAAVEFRLDPGMYLVRFDGIKGNSTSKLMVE